MQDWEWEVADAARFDEFLDAFRSTALSDNERFSLMEILVQCTEASLHEEELVARWTAIEPLLKARRALHSATIEYWACLGESDPAAMFRVSPLMRSLLNA